MVRLRQSLVLLSLCLVGVQPPAALAVNEWCDTDPVFVVRTPAGNLVPLYVDVGAQSVVYTPDTLLGALQVSYTAVPATNHQGDVTGTRVTFTVTVPPAPDAGAFATRAVVSTGPLKTGTVYAQASGWSGQPMEETFLLPSH